MVEDPDYGRRSVRFVESRSPDQASSENLLLSMVAEVENEAKLVQAAMTFAVHFLGWKCSCHQSYAQEAVVEIGL